MINQNNNVIFQEKMINSNKKSFLCALFHKICRMLLVRYINTYGFLIFNYLHNLMIIIKFYSIRLFKNNNITIQHEFFE